MTYLVFLRSWRVTKWELPWWFLWCHSAFLRFSLIIALCFSLISHPYWNKFARCSCLAARSLSTLGKNRQPLLHSALGGDALFAAIDEICEISSHLGWHIGGEDVFVCHNEGAAASARSGDIEERTFDTSHWELRKWCSPLRGLALCPQRKLCRVNRQRKN